MSAATEMSVPVELPVDLYSREVFDNPLPVWKAIRDAGPVVRVQRGYWAIGRFSEIKPILKDWETFSSARESSVNEVVNRALKGGVLRTDPPEHAALREIIMRPLTPTRLKELRPRIAAVADQLVERLCSIGGFDAATDLAEHLPLTVVSELVGLPDDAKAEMLSWAKASFNANSPTDVP